MPKFFRTSRANVICMGFFILPGTAVFTVLGIMEMRDAAASAAIGPAFILAGLLFLLFFVHHASINVEVTSTEIIRRNIFGSKSLRLEDVVSALFSSVRGIVFLTIRTPAKWQWMQLSTYTFSRDQLQQVQDLLQADARMAARPFHTAASQPTPKEWIGIIAFELVLMFFVFAIVAIAGVNHLHAVRASREVPTSTNR